MSKSKYRIEEREHTYSYRSYMACEDNGQPDCTGTGVTYYVYRGNRLLKQHSFYDDAKQHLKRLRKIEKQKVKP